MRACILYHILMPDVMERINLNVPPDARRKLRKMAADAGRTEAEMARELLLDALERARRQEFYRRVAAGYTPAARARDLAIACAFARAGR